MWAYIGSIFEDKGLFEKKNASMFISPVERAVSGYPVFRQTMARYWPEFITGFRSIIFIATALRPHKVMSLGLYPKMK